MKVLISSNRRVQKLTIREQKQTLNSPISMLSGSQIQKEKSMRQAVSGLSTTVHKTNESWYRLLERESLVLIYDFLEIERERECVCEWGGERNFLFIIIFPSGLEDSFCVASHSYTTEWNRTEGRPEMVSEFKITNIPLIQLPRWVILTPTLFITNKHLVIKYFTLLFNTLIMYLKYPHNLNLNPQIDLTIN